jgi:hypothetical protein
MVLAALVIPLLIVSWLAGARLVFHARRLRLPIGALLVGFLREVIGTGFVWLVVLILAVAILTFISKSGQAAFWLVLAPWSFAAGAVRGLVTWNGRIAAFKPDPSSAPPH